MSANVNFSVLVVGHQGCGKSTYCHKLALAHPRKVLVVSPDDNESIWTPYPDLFQSTSNDEKIRRAIYMKELNYGLVRFSNGLIVFDDCRYYTSKHDQFFVKLMIRKRQHNRDMIFVTHTLHDFPPSLMQFVNGVYLFPFFDTPERLRSRIYDYTRFEQVWNRVNQTKIPEYFPIFA